MMRKRVIRADRVRTIEGSFGFIEHRFLGEGFLESLSHEALLLYLLLILAADRQGLSYYGPQRIGDLLGLSRHRLVLAEAELITKDLLACDGRLYQVLSLPPGPVSADSHPA